MRQTVPNYVSATKTVSLTVTKATPVINWLAPAEITYGTKLGSAQLNATANVNGTLAYTPAAGAVLDGGSQTLSVTFTPHDSANYSSATKTVSMFVRKSQPHMNIDRPSNDSVSGSSVTIEGWAVDLSGTSGAGINAVHVWAYPRSTAPAMFLGAATLGLDRPDVAAVFGLPRLRFSGFSLTVPSLAAGGYQLVVFARSDVTGTFNQSVTMNLTVAAPDPVTRIDVPTNGSVLLPSFTIAGWSIDRASPTGSGINALHAYAYPAAGGSPIFLGAASYGATRADVGASFGQRFTPSGFSLNATLSPGDVHARAVSAEHRVERLREPRREPGDGCDAGLAAGAQHRHTRGRRRGR